MGQLEEGSVVESVGPDLAAPCPHTGSLSPGDLHRPNLCSTLLHKERLGHGGEHGSRKALGCIPSIPRDEEIVVVWLLIDVFLGGTGGGVAALGRNAGGVGGARRRRVVCPPIRRLRVAPAHRGLMRRRRRESAA